MVNQRDLLALELVETASLLADMLNRHVGRHPVGAEQRIVPHENGAVLRLAATVAGGNQRDLVNRRLVGQGKGHASGERLDDGRPTILALQALVAFHAAVGGVTELAFLEGNLDTVDPALGIDQLEIVDIAVSPGVAVRRIGTGAVNQDGEELLLGLRESGRRGDGRGDADGGQGNGQGKRADFHLCLLQNVDW